MATMPALMPNVDGEKLRALREDRFLSHRELAKLAGVSPTTVLNLETNPETTAQRRTVRKLAKALAVQPRDLVQTGDSNG
jgi:DNA-binding XRE family transcriptional regulator